MNRREVIVLTGAALGNVAQFVRRGGGLVASGATSLYDEWGRSRSDFALADLFAIHAPSDFGRAVPPLGASYLRLTPELRGGVWGPEVCG
jgi:hypothetical protein